ncbi:hypothetical protein [Hathewaya massiliensis]|uniref:hypothetical protein n=1 Tax=Hathewaya massiliensis TaxID=1964382 RepID=UPI0011581765|nr:hypothetical protein [Hathewaya massiliensis]
MINNFSIAGPNSKYKLPGAQAAGFLAGVWHGLIAPITFIVSMFNPNIRIYETNNVGRLYDLGFVIGISTSFGGSGSRVK